MIFDFVHMIVELNDINKASSGQPIISRFTPYEFKNTIDKIQTLDILGQLESGISEQFYVTHDKFNFIDDVNLCSDKKEYNVLSFINVINYCDKFLMKHNTETIIIHLKLEDTAKDLEIDEVTNLINDIFDSYGDRIYDLLYFTESSDEKYENKNMPTLGEVRSKELKKKQKMPQIELKKK
ncbi:hypothetical protein H8356DRAFT_1372008 [Neocallimastix lanati (nom. inval.)]|uniref:Uncharacterized protein n=1 Tax=Neocallimastix californiae TaxID=1754190 RepID=A0A1Y2A8L9_9FUNG|nr:hypothetical protein H8356DRAFT_1372008 [Neocallimastix sp. JGI-2020a]ORY18657.1 hypothetical protein LY90DRAFT_517386 [Neocallimastix californiae]|eukprot:ORY18657.1 hypothetical protein LY90DRAFT_517386 [Neocallimastix californiae]